MFKRYSNTNIKNGGGVLYHWTSRRTYFYIIHFIKYYDHTLIWKYLKRHFNVSFEKNNHLINELERWGRLNSVQNVVLVHLACYPGPTDRCKPCGTCKLVKYILKCVCEPGFTGTYCNIGKFSTHPNIPAYITNTPQHIPRTPEHIRTSTAPT